MYKPLCLFQSWAELEQQRFSLEHHLLHIVRLISDLNTERGQSNRSQYRARSVESLSTPSEVSRIASTISGKKSLFQHRFSVF